MVVLPLKSWLSYVPALFLGGSAMLALADGITGDMVLSEAALSAAIQGLAAVLGLRRLGRRREPVAGWARTAGGAGLVILFVARHLTEISLLRTALDTGSTLILWLLYPEFAGWLLATVSVVLALLSVLAHTGVG